MKPFLGGRLPEIILILGIFVSLADLNEATYHQQNKDDYRKSTDEDVARGLHPDDYAAVDLKRLQPEASTSQYDYYDYSNRDYPNYDHNMDDNSTKSNDDYENHDFDSKRANGGFVTHGLEKSIPGTAGMDYPNYNLMPRTEFNCQDHPDAGLYGDIETDCQMFHICQVDGRHDTFLCPVGTIFNQKHFICDWWFNYNCSETPQFFSLNSMIYQNPSSTGDNRKHKHMHHGRRKNFFLKGLMKKIGLVMDDDKETKSEVMDKFQGKINNETYISNKEEHSTKKDDSNLKNGIWEPMRRYRRVNVRKISLHPIQDYALPRQEYLTDERSISDHKNDNLDKRTEHHMTTINYAIQLLHKNLNPLLNMDPQSSSTSNVEYATASGLTNADDRNHLNALPDHYEITESMRLTMNTQNKQYLPAITISSELDPTHAFSTENYLAENITIFDSAVSSAPEHIDVSKVEDNLFPSNLRNGDERSFTVVDNSVTEFQDLISSDKRNSEEKLPDFDSERQIPIDANNKQNSVPRTSTERKRNFMLRRRGMRRSRWRQRLIKKQQKGIKTKPETEFVSRNTTSLFKAKRHRNGKPSKPQPKVEWMFYPRNDTTRLTSWNDFVRERRRMLKAKDILQNNEGMIPNKFSPSSISSIQNDDHYSSTVSIIASTGNDNHNSEKEERVQKAFGKNPDNQLIDQRTKSLQMDYASNTNHTEEDNPDKIEETSQYISENFEKGRNRKLSKITVNRRCKAVCIKLIKNRLLNLEEGEDGMYTLDTNNRNLQWLNIRRSPVTSSITEYQPQTAESGSIISKQSSCGENLKDSFSGWSIIIDRGTVTKEKTIKKKCILKHNPNNRQHKGNLFDNNQLKNVEGKHVTDQGFQNAANFRQLWLQNFQRRGIHSPTTFSKDEILLPSESGMSGEGEDGNSRYRIRDHQRGTYENHPTVDSDSQRSTIDWKQKWLQGEILRASSFNVDSQSQQSPPNQKQNESHQNRAAKRDSITGWKKDSAKQGLNWIDTRTMPTNVSPLSKIVWPPGARGSKIDWSQSTRDNPISPKFSNTNWFIEMRDPKSTLPNEPMAQQVDSTSNSQSNTSSTLNDINEELVSEFKTFLKGVFLKISANQVQPSTRNGSIISNNKHWIFNVTNSEKDKNLDLHNIYLLRKKNSEDDLFPPSDLFLRDRPLSTQHTNDFSLYNNRQEKTLASDNWSSSENPESQDMDYRHFENDSSIHGQDFQASWQLDHRNVSDYQHQEDFLSHDASRSWALEGQLTGWPEDKLTALSFNYNITQNGKSSNNKGTKDNQPFGVYDSQRNINPDNHDFISTNNPNAQKGSSRNAQNSEKNSSRNLDWNMNWPSHNTQDKASLGVSQKGWATASNNNQQNWPSNVKNSRNSFPSVKQDSSNNWSSAGEGNQKGWSTDDEDFQQRWMGYQSSEKGSDDTHPLKDWLFDTVSTQQMPPSNTQGQTKGWQGANPKNGWSLDTQNLGLRDSNTQRSDKIKSFDMKDVQESYSSTKNNFGNRMGSDFSATKDNWQPSNNKGQSKGRSDSTMSQNNWPLFSYNPKMGWQSDNTDTRNDKRSGNQQPAKGWSSGHSRNDETAKKQMQQNHSPSNSKSLYRDGSFDIPKDDWSSNGSKDNWSSNISKDYWPSNIPKDNWSSNSRQNTKGSLLSSHSSNGRGSSDSKGSKNGWSFDQGVSKGVSSKANDEWKSNSQNSKAQSQTSDTKNSNPSWSSTYKGSDGNKTPESRSDDMQNKNMKKMQSRNSKSNTNIRMPKNRRMMKKIRWSVQIDGNGKPKSGWIPITLRPLLNVPTKSKGDKMRRDEDDEWSSWSNDPRYDNNESKKRDNIDISKIIDTQASENKLLWVPSINSTSHPSAKSSSNTQQLLSPLNQLGTKQEWSVPFDGITIPVSGWLPIFNIKTMPPTENKNKISVINSKNESKFNALNSEDSKNAKYSEIFPHKQLYNKTNKIFMSTDILSKKNETNETNKRDNQKQAIQHSSQKMSLSSTNISTTGTRTNNSEYLHSTIITQGDISKHIIVRQKEIPKTTRVPPIVSNELKTKFMQVGHNETLRVLPFSLIHEQLNHASKEEGGFKAIPFKTEVLKSSISVKPSIHKSHNSHQSNVTNDEKRHQYTTFTDADGRMHSPSHHHPSTNLEWIFSSHTSDRTNISSASSHNVTKFSNRTSDSINNEPKVVITNENVHKL